jgi:lysophospholipase L1-like esterase
MKRNLFPVLLLLAVFAAGCSEEDRTPSGPNSFGSIDKSVYVAVGNSITAGYQSGTLCESWQVYSYPNLIAQQLGTSFVQPIMPDPGTGQMMRITSMNPVTVISDTVSRHNPTNITHPAPYNNLGIPKAVIFDGMDTEEFTAKSTRLLNPFFAMILRNQALGASQIQQAINLRPTLVTFWLGSNNVLGYAMQGGWLATMWDVALFDPKYREAVRTIRDSLPNAKIVIANIPDVNVIPFFTTVGPVMSASLVKIQKRLYFQTHGNKGSATPLDSTDFRRQKNMLVTLAGKTYAAFLGMPTGIWYRDCARQNRIPIESILDTTIIDTTKAFGLDPRNPWPDALILDMAEQTNIENTTASYNSAIEGAYNSLNTTPARIALVDINGLFKDIHANGYSVSGETFSTAYISGGLFSLDGIHPSSKGNGVIANAFIAAMNAKFGANIPMVDISRIPGMPVPLAKRGKIFDFNVAAGTYDNVIRLFQQ